MHRNMNIKFVENIVDPERATDDNIIERMLLACWIAKAIDTHSDCVVLIAFPLQQWLSERDSVLL
jgi:hypothetical protein